jgi:hypothetical protein
LLLLTLLLLPLLLLTLLLLPLLLLTLLPFPLLLLLLLLLSRLSECKLRGNKGQRKSNQDHTPARAN